MLFRSGRCGVHRLGAGLGLPAPWAARNPQGLAPTSPPHPDLCIPGEVKAQSGMGLLGSHGKLAREEPPQPQSPQAWASPGGSIWTGRTGPWEGGPLLLQALLAGVGGTSRVCRCPLLTSSADTTMEGSLSPARFHKIQGRFSWTRVQFRGRWACRHWWTGFKEGF